MRLVLLFVLSIVLHFAEPLSGEIINQPVVNIYCDPEEDTSVNSQAIYGSVVEIIEKLDPWLKVKTSDGTLGWVKTWQVTNNIAFETDPQLVSVKSLFAHIYRTNDTVPFPPLLTLPYGSKVKLKKYKEKRWLQAELISGEKVWIQNGDFDFFPRFKSLEETIEFSKQFLGLPYTWGGTSSYGYDCSGFMQMLFKEMGFLIPRNSRDQAQSKLFIPVDRDKLQRGDLIFFGEARINHVGLYLGDHEFIHSGVTELPMIMISSLQNRKYHFHSARRISQDLLVPGDHLDVQAFFTD